jgi:hypothetical protein
LTLRNSGDIIRVITALFIASKLETTVSVGEDNEHNESLPRQLRVVEWISSVPAIANLHGLR